MHPRRSVGLIAAFVGAAALVAGCSPADGAGDAASAGNGAPASASPPAMAVPTHVLTEDKAQVPADGEQGDIFAIKLDEGAQEGERWALTHQSGDAKIVALGDAELVQEKTGPKRVFRFRAAGIGTAELRFELRAAQSVEPSRSVTFKLHVR